MRSSLFGYFLFLFIITFVGCGIYKFQLMQVFRFATHWEVVLGLAWEPY